MDDKRPAINLSNPNTFDHWTPVTIRFSDQDSMGHVNNVAIAAYVESGRNRFVANHLDWDVHPDIDFVLARVSIDYKSELHHPGTVDVGTCVKRVGSKSITIGTGIFFGERLIATAESVNVFINTNSRETVSIPRDSRMTLEAERAKAAGAG